MFSRHGAAASAAERRRANAARVAGGAQDQSGAPADLGDLPPLEGTRYQLDPDKVLDTARRLARRIGDRFPESGLRQQAEGLVKIGERAKQRIAWIAQPIWPLRLCTYLLVAGLALAVVVLFVKARNDVETWSLKDTLEAIDAGVNDLVMTGVGIFFLVTLETRIKRRRALHALHELRSVAHVIDMHQLTKDPDRLVRGRHNTASSPKNTLSAFELRRYLDYCSEMLSLTGKIAATYLQRFDDPAAVAAVNEIEDLTTGLSRKIWQKIMILGGPVEGSGRQL